MLSAQDCTLLLQHLPETGTAAYWKLLERFTSVNAAFSAPLDQLAPLLSPAALKSLADYRQQGMASVLGQQFQRAMHWYAENDIHVVLMASEHYPSLLREVKKAPPVLYVMGDPMVLSLPQIAIVGSRSPSPGGRSNATAFAASLARAGFTITSGLALGVDIAAHQGALSVQGKTIAILGTGIDQIYPQRHLPMARQIAASGGAVVTEFPFGTAPIPANFPQRNRIISGLSAGVLVVEAAVKSGSLITARYALQQNREVFAIPGSIHNPLSRGCHALIKEGAKLVESAQDIVEELPGYFALKWEEVGTADLFAEPAHASPSSPQDRLVLAQVGFDAAGLDDICERAALPVGDVMASLLSLELTGLVLSHGNTYMRVR